MALVVKVTSQKLFYYWNQKKKLPEATPGEYDGCFLFVVCCLANNCFSRKLDEKERCFDE
jgi:hypothetical protein